MPRPWSLVAFAIVAVWLLARAQGRTGEEFEIASSQGIQWALLTTAVFIAVLSPALVRAERFIFPAYFIIGAIGVVAAIRRSRSVRPSGGADRPLSLAPGRGWMVTFLLSLGSKVVRLYERGPYINASGRTPCS